MLEIVTVAASIAEKLVAYAVGAGVSRGALLAMAQVDSQTLSDPNGRVAFESYLALLRGARALTGDALFALKFGADVAMREMSILGMLGMVAETVEEGFAQVNRFASLAIDVGDGQRFTFEPANRGVWVIDQRGPQFDDPLFTESAFARLARSLAEISPDAVLLALEVTYARPPHCAAYDQYLRAPIRYLAGRNAFLIDRGLFGHSLTRQPDYLRSALVGHAERLLVDYRRIQTLAGRVDAMLESRLAEGAVGIGDIAGLLGTTRWTLARRLREEGTSFEAVRDALRLRLAHRHLADPTLQVGQVGYLLGYSEPAAFTRAFRRWTGASPQQHRARLASAEA